LVYKDDIQFLALAALEVANQRIRAPVKVQNEHLAVEARVGDGFGDHLRIRAVGDHDELAAVPRRNLAFALEVNLQNVVHGHGIRPALQGSQLRVQQAKGRRRRNGDNEAAHVVETDHLGHTRGQHVHVGRNRHHGVRVGGIRGVFRRVVVLTNTRKPHVALHLFARDGVGKFENVLVRDAAAVEEVDDVTLQAAVASEEGCVLHHVARVLVEECVRALHEDQVVVWKH